ncbi:cadherin repeat domain-containing protein [Formosa maritima]|uniref:Cadherin repeat domain-containing protein n=1 Tax=Formosa maritima TaxID=2592046 RepID=A0A5D0GIN4_9FLAO|nr:cadherin repeat domain-containing protein [Formosa maritima]TYA58875.1 cadherin repeat domain-containing protein [Formosa maritima]
MKYIFAICSLILLFSCSSDDIETTVTTNNFTTTIDENPTLNFVLGTIDGSTNNGSVTFSIQSESVDGALFINSSTGVLKVKDESLFDFETNPTITGKVKVANGTTSKLANVTINLNNLDDPHIGIGSWTLWGQLEVDLFGLNKYTEITGILYIDGQYNVNIPTYSLLPLIDLKKVGSLQIINNPSLTNLEGLNNVEIVTNGLRIQSNPLLTNINDLNSLSRVSGGFVIDLNNSLENLDGLNNLNKAFGGLSIYKNHSLVNIDGLYNLDQVTNQLNISNNYELFNFCGITNLIENGGLLGEYNTYFNGYDPTIQDILDGNCQM